MSTTQCQHHKCANVWLIVLLSLLWGHARLSLLLLFLFLFGWPCLSWSTTLRQPWNTGCDYWTLQTRSFQLFFSWPQVVPAPLFYHSDLVPTFAHYMSGPSGPIPNYTFCPFAFQHPLPPGPSGYTSYAASWFKLPTPPPLWRRQWWWLLELVHPGRQGKGIDQAPGGELAPE